MSGPLSTLSLLETLAESTRFRIVNCLSAAPLFVSELQVLLDVPQPTVSRHLRVLREVGLVRDTPIGQFVLYRLRRPPEPLGRVLAAALDAARDEPALRGERANASTEGRRHPRQRTAPPLEGRTP